MFINTLLQIYTWNSNLGHFSQIFIFFLISEYIQNIVHIIELQNDEVNVHKNNFKIKMKK